MLVDPVPDVEWWAGPDACDGCAGLDGWDAEAGWEVVQGGAAADAVKG